MSTALNPPFQTVSTVRSSILGNLKLELPPAILANTIAPLLSTVNLWSSQIPVMLEGSGTSNSANLVFAIRKDLFQYPLYTQCVLGPIVDLPPPFHEFIAFILKLIEAQKGDKEKPVPKVRLVRSLFIWLFHIRYFSIHSPANVLLVLSSPSPSWMTTMISISLPPL